MEQNSKEIEYQAKKNLEEALYSLKWRCSPSSYSKMELNYAGNQSIRSLLHYAEKQFNELIVMIQTEEKSYEDYSRKYGKRNDTDSHIKHKSNGHINNDHNNEYLDKDRLELSLRNIDEFIKFKGDKIANLFFDVLKQQQKYFYSQGLGHPWGTEFRRRIAVLAGLKKEVNSLWEVGLNSIANSQHIYLGNHFVDLIKKDPAMDLARLKIDELITFDIKKNFTRVPYLDVQRIDKRITGSLGSVEFGGKRTDGSMLMQLRNSLRNPIASLTKYAETWNVAMNELTWCLRHGEVKYDCIYHAVYNLFGFAYIFESRFDIKDTLDLRPHSNNKLDFGSDYNIVTSLLGTIYHDLLGNTDKLKVSASWREDNLTRSKIIPWRT